MARILIIDDDKSFRVTLEQRLNDRGHPVATANDGLTGRTQAHI